jgi:hypothetical protein
MRNSTVRKTALALQLANGASYSVNSNQNSPLLRLPPEIRNHIWEYTMWNGLPTDLGLLPQTAIQSQSFRMCQYLRAHEGL